MFSNSTPLPRQDLADAILKAATTHGLTVVVAPTGYGKTTLARFLAEAVENTFYYATPVGPHDARFLWHDMSRQFEAQGMDIAPIMNRLGFPETAFQSRQALEQLHGLEAPMVLLLDDYHHVTDPAMNVFWESVIKAPIPHAHIVLFSRSRPDMNLEELRIKGLAAVFEQNLLAFSEAETEAYFRLNGVDDAAVAREAWRCSEGWPAALWLCLQDHKANGRIGLPDMDSLLSHTVFAAYTGEERDFLLRLSVLEHFTEADVETIAVTPSLSVRLQTLRDKNAFLSFDPKTGFYQFHGLFRDYLRKELAAAPHIDKPSLYRLAGECCAKRGELVPAFRLFLKAGRDEDLARLLDLFLHVEKDRNTVYFAEEFFNATLSLPWSARVLNPLAYLSFVGLYSIMWNDYRTATLLDEAEERFRAAQEIPEYLRARLKGEIEILRALQAFNDMDEVWRRYGEACRFLSGPSILLSRHSVWNFSSPSLAFIILRSAGGYRKMVETMEREAHVFRKLSGGLGKDGEIIIRAEYLLERGEFSLAAPLLQDVLRRCDSGRHAASALTAAFSMARLCVATGFPDDGVHVLDALRPGLQRLNVVEHDECREIAVGYINAVLGRTDAVPQWLREGELFEPPHCWQPQVFGFSLTVHCKTLLLREDYRQLAARAVEIPTCAAPLDCLFSHIHSGVLKAIAAWQREDQTAALSFLREALDLARPDGILLSLAEYGGHLIPLLHRFKRIATAEEDAHLEAVLTLARRIAHVSGCPAQNGNKELLSLRERELMRHVLKGQSNRFIAESLGVSVDAVKKGLSRAYAKMGVSSRVEAGRRFTGLYGDSLPD